MKTLSDISDSLSRTSSAFLNFVDSNNWNQMKEWSPVDSIESHLDDGLGSDLLELDPHDFQGYSQTLSIQIPDYEHGEVDDLDGNRLPDFLDLRLVPDFNDPDSAIDLIEDDLVAERTSFACWTKSFGHLKPIFYSNLASSAFHVLLIFVATFVAYAEATGQGGTRHQPMFVSLVDPRSNEVCKPSLASIDSAASLPSIADRSRKNGNDSGDEGVSRTKKLSDCDQAGSLDQEQENSDASAVNTARLVDSDFAKNKNSTDQDDVDFKSKSMQDAPASVASTAQHEKRSDATRGDLINDFKLKLLEAIHQAAYFPRKALRSKNLGEVMVSFTIIDSGELQDLRINKSSGSELLDETALQILQKASEHFPRIPEQSQHKKLTYVVPISFRK